MKKRLLTLILGLGLVLSQTACKKAEKKPEVELEKVDNTTSQTTEQEDSTEKEVKTPETEKDQENNQDPDKKDSEKDTESKDKNNEEEGTKNLSIEEEIKMLEENSDYISIIKMSQTGANGKEINVIEDLKGSLTNIVVPDIPNIEANYNYLVFLMDSETGEITLTDTERGLVLIENENNEKLKILNTILEEQIKEKENN